MACEGRLPESATAAGALNPPVTLDGARRAWLADVVGLLVWGGRTKAPEAAPLKKREKIPCQSWALPVTKFPVPKPELFRPPGTGTVPPELYKPWPRYALVVGSAFVMRNVYDSVMESPTFTSVMGLLVKTAAASIKPLLVEPFS